MVLIRFLNVLHFSDATLQSVRSRNSEIYVITRYMRIIIIKKTNFPVKPWFTSGLSLSTPCIYRFVCILLFRI